MADYVPQFDGFFPYLNTGVSTSASMMNHLYSGGDELVNTMTNGKSAFFLNTSSYKEIQLLGSPGNTLIPCWNMYEARSPTVFEGSFAETYSWPSTEESSCLYDLAFYGMHKMRFQENYTGAGFGVRQFYFTSGVQSGNCDPNAPDTDGNCNGINAFYPVAATGAQMGGPFGGGRDMHGSQGWVWRLYGFWYSRRGTLAGNERETVPATYKHELYEKIAKEASVFDYNSERDIALVIENGIYTNDYGRGQVYYTNPINGKSEKLPCPYAISSTAGYFCTNLDHSLGVHEVTLENPSLIPSWTESKDSIIINPQEDLLSGDLVIDFGGYTGATGAGALLVGGDENQVDQPDTPMKYVDGLAKSAAKPIQESFESYSSTYYASREKIKDISNKYDIHVCPHTHEEELSSIEEMAKAHRGIAQAITADRTGVSGQDCTQPYQCWLYQSKLNYWEDFKQAIDGLKTGDVTFDITYSLARAGTAINAPSSYQTTFEIKSDAVVDTWANTNGANGINPSGHSISVSDYESEIAGAFAAWKEVIEKTYSGCYKDCKTEYLEGDETSKLTVNFVNLGQEYSAAEALPGIAKDQGKGAEDFPIYSATPSWLNLDVGTGYGPLNMGRIRIAVAETGGWTGNAAAAFAFMPDQSATNSWQGDIVINPNHNYKRDNLINTDYFSNPEHKEVSLKYILAHEIGHSLGFGHSNSAKCNTPMNPVYFWNESFESGWSGSGLAENTDGKCIEELYGDCQAGAVCLSGMKMASFFMTPLGQTGFNSAYNDSVFFPWYWPRIEEHDYIYPGEPIANCIQYPQECAQPWANTNVPIVENRFEQAEIIIDGPIFCTDCGLDHAGKDQFYGYKLFTFSNKWNKYKFFRIHNLNNYDMKFVFEPDEGLELVEDPRCEVKNYGFTDDAFSSFPDAGNTDGVIPETPSSCSKTAGLAGENDEAKKISVGLFQKSMSLAQRLAHEQNGTMESEGYVVVSECGAGTGCVIDIPKNESICVRRDFGEYTIGYRHFQKFLPGDLRVNQELAEEDVGGFDAYPKYYHPFPARDHYSYDRATHNVVKPFALNNWIDLLNDRLVIDDTPPRVWNANSLYLDPLDYETLADGTKEKNLKGRTLNGVSYFHPYDELLQPTWYNSYQHNAPDDYTVSPLNENTVLADFIYHTGFVVQNYALAAGEADSAVGTSLNQRPDWSGYKMSSAGENVTGAYLKRMVPYSGARYIYRFLQDLNVNVAAIGPSKQVTYGDPGEIEHGRSGLFAGPTGFLSGTTSARLENDSDRTAYFDSSDVKAQGMIPLGGNQWVIGHQATTPNFTPLNDPMTSKARSTVGWPVSGEHSNQVADLQQQILDVWASDTCPDGPSAESCYKFRKNFDPFALSINQYNLSTNILGGKGAWNYTKGQIYPLVNGLACGTPSKILPSFVDFGTHHDISYGKHYLAKFTNTGLTSWVTGGNYGTVSYTELDKYVNHYKENDHEFDGTTSFPYDCYPNQKLPTNSAKFGNYGWAESGGAGFGTDFLDDEGDEAPCVHMYHPLTGAYRVKVGDDANADHLICAYDPSATAWRL